MSDQVSEQLAVIKRALKASKGRLILHAQEPSNNHHWTAHVCEASREDWLLLVELAEAAVNISNAISARKAAQ